MNQGRESSGLVSSIEKVRDAFIEINHDTREWFGGESLCATIRGFCAAKGVSDPMDLAHEDRAILIVRLSAIKSKLDSTSTEYLAMCGVVHASELSRAQYSIFCERLQAVVHREDQYPFPA